MQTEYVYDAPGQLIRVNDPRDPTNNSNGTTWTYEYDRGGNILNRRRYAFTTGPLGTVQATDVYAYTDTDWKDKLTNYNGTAISYDPMGNPTNDGTWTYEWEHGRQLKQMSKSGTTAGFVYNKDGLRVQKTVNGVVTHYTLHGKNIVHMTQGSNDLHFYYDAQNRLAEIVFNGTPYGVIHNLQGDVVGLFDSTGTEVVRYTYDAWGKPLSKTGSLAGTLGTLNPFRYRGYVFDEETGLYYLRSRYYKSEWNRFINADAIVHSAEHIVCSSIYCYCNNCPVDNIDTNGKDSTPVTTIDEVNFNKFQEAYYRSTGRSFHFPRGNWNYTCSIYNNVSHINTTQISQEVSTGVTWGGGVISLIGVGSLFIPVARWATYVGTTSTIVGGCLSFIGVYGCTTNDDIPELDEYQGFVISITGEEMCGIEEYDFENFGKPLFREVSYSYEYLYLEIGEHSGMMFDLKRGKKLK